MLTKQRLAYSLEQHRWCGIMLAVETRHVLGTVQVHLVVGTVARTGAVASDKDLLERRVHSLLFDVF